jgi:hypothetical protein
VLEDPAIDEQTKATARSFLNGYAPWDAATSRRIREALR